MSRVFRDGNKWCCVEDDFINLQESFAGFGDTPLEAEKALLLAIAFAAEKPGEEA